MFYWTQTSSHCCLKASCILKPLAMKRIKNKYYTFREQVYNPIHLMTFISPSLGVEAKVLQENAPESHQMTDGTYYVENPNQIFQTVGWSQCSRYIHFKRRHLYNSKAHNTLATSSTKPCASTFISIPLSKLFKNFH